MQLSYWEQKEWLTNVDFTIVGSGIVGLSTAISLKEKFPEAKILVLERGILPQGASTKNAGFACFGSASELLADLQSHTDDEVLALVEKRWRGLESLRNLLGDKTIDYKPKKGYEVFLNESASVYNNCINALPLLNKLLFSLFKEDVYKTEANIFQFKGIQENYIVNQFEGQLDTGKMMQGFLQLATSKGIKIINNTSVTSFESSNNSVEIVTNHFTFSTHKLLIAANGFAQQLGIQDVLPARAQVLITKPIKNLAIKGTFHLDEGYYYFRNIDNRILLGGGRNLDIKGETTAEFGETTQIQNKLEELLQTVILPYSSFEIDQRWSGIMGVGNKKKPIVKRITPNVLCGVRLGGMGVAIGTQVGKELADLV